MKCYISMKLKKFALLLLYLIVYCVACHSPAETVDGGDAQTRHEHFVDANILVEHRFEVEKVKSNDNERQEQKGLENEPGEQTKTEYKKSIDVDFVCPEKSDSCPKFPSMPIFELSYKAEKGKTFWGPSQVVITQNHIITYDKTSSISTDSSQSFYTTVYAINFSGKLLWKLPIAGKGIHLLAGGNETVILTTRSQGSDGIGKPEYPITSIYAMNLSNGKRLWFKDFKRRSLSIPSSNGKTLFLADNKLLAIDTRSGQMLWERLIPITSSRMLFRNAQPVVGKQSVYVSSPTGSIVSFSKNGDLLWSTGIPSASKSLHQIVLDRKGNLYCASGEMIFSLSSKGVIRWKYSAFAVKDLKWIVMDDSDHLYSVSERNGLHILSLDAVGKLLWKYPLKNERLFLPPTVTDKGILFTGKCESLSCLKLVNKKGELQSTFFGYPQINQSLLIDNQLKRTYFWTHEGNILSSHKATLIAAQLDISHAKSWFTLYGNSLGTSSLE